MNWQRILMSVWNALNSPIGIAAVKYAEKVLFPLTKQRFMV